MTTDVRARAAAELDRARIRSLALTDADDNELTHQHSVLMSPLVWDLAHVGNQEELWLVRDVGGRAPSARTSTISTTRSSSPGATGPGCRCSARPRRAATSAPSATRSSTCLTRSRSRAGRWSPTHSPSA